MRAAVFRAAPSRRTRTELARELAAQPTLLTSGRPGRSAVVSRLIDQLVAAGSVAVSRPHCTLCRRIADLPMVLVGGGRACGLS